ncbi:MAG: hypothetical protein IIX78_01975, partial [Alistipes sp.]|nr:hypothetical protein [Alistipes sp.]
VAEFMIMDRWLRLVCCFAALGLMVGSTSCSKDDDINTPEEKAEFYVKYKARTQYSLITSIVVSTPEGNLTISGNRQSYEQTFGPVSKGFVCYIKASQYPDVVEIYVCRGAEPFALKASGKTTATYAIDF